jgi:hypothetical protein
VTLDGAGHATIRAPLTGPAGVLGNVSPITTLTWGTTPANASSTALVLGFNVQGQSGLLWNKVISYVDTRPLPRAMVPGRIFTLGVRFTTFRKAPGVAQEDNTTTLTSVVGNVNLTGTADTPPNPVDQFTATTQ